MGASCIDQSTTQFRCWLIDNHKVMMKEQRTESSGGAGVDAATYHVGQRH
jgi:hypothetical protein